MPVNTLKEMEAEVVAYCEAKGWRSAEVPFPQAMALLHEEVAEAGHAWRVWGLEDATAGSADKPGGDRRAKPEGVGSEFADVLIRLLDDSALFGLDLPAAYPRTTVTHVPVAGHFLTDVNTLHGLIARATTEWDDGHGSPDVPLSGMLAYLVKLSRHYGIDLDFEYRRKMDYNHTREYRHGGRRA